MSTNSKGITVYQESKANSSSISGEQSRAKAAYARLLAILQFLAHNDWLEHKNHLEIQSDCKQAMRSIEVAYPEIAAEISSQDILEAGQEFANNLNTISLKTLQQYHKIYEEYFALADKKCPDSLQRQHDLFMELRNLKEKHPEIKYRLLLDQANGTFKPIDASEQSISSYATKKSPLTPFFENNNSRISSKEEKSLSTTTNNDANSHSVRTFFTSATEAKQGFRNIASPFVVQSQASYSTPNYSLKILIIGDASVGKTSLLKCFSNDSYAENIPPGEVSNPEKRTITLNQSSVELRVQDKSKPSKSGPREPIPFSTIKPNSIIVAFDVTNRKSFENVANWLTEIQYYAHPDSIVALAATKCDVPEAEWKVSKKEIEEFARSVTKNVFFTSAKNNSDVDELFADTANSVIQNTQSTPLVLYIKPR